MTRRIRGLEVAYLQDSRSITLFTGPLMIESSFVSGHVPEMIRWSFRGSRSSPLLRTAGALLPLGLLLVFTGCATSKIDWNSRVGSYTYDRAVQDMGPPEKFAMLSDNSIVAEWLTKRGYTKMVPLTGTAGRIDPPYTAYRTVNPPGATYSTVTASDHFLKLIFGPDLKLRSWERVTR